MKAEKKATSSANKKHAHSTSTNQLQNSSQIQTVEIQESISSVTSASTLITSRKSRLHQQQQKQMFSEAAVRNNFYVNNF